MAAEHGKRVIARARHNRVERRVVRHAIARRHDLMISSSTHTTFLSRRQEMEPTLPGVYAQFVTSEGSFTVRLFDQEAPKTVENFVGLAEGTKEWTDPRTNKKVTAPYYDGVIFHRVINGFMIQSGDPLGQGIGGRVTSSRTSSTRRCATTRPASCRWPTADRTPTAGSFSSPSADSASRRSSFSLW